METEADITGTTPRRRPKPDVMEIGGRKLKPATLMMGHGFDPALSENSLKAPIFLTSTFVFENAAAGKRHFEGVTGKRPGGADGLVYSRFNGPNQEILEDRLTLLHRQFAQPVTGERHGGQIRRTQHVAVGAQCLGAEVRQERFDPRHGVEVRSRHVAPRRRRRLRQSQEQPAFTRAEARGRRR